MNIVTGGRMETIERSKRDKFLELANKRVSRALKDIQLVGNLANRKNYEYSDDEAKKIVKALQSEVERVKQHFHSGAQPASNKFEL